MKLRYPPLNELKTFHAVAQAGRFRKAAEILGVTESAVSHHIRRLEQRLGVRLLEKEGREMQLSTAGARYYQAVRQSLEALSEATDELMATPGRARVTLTLPTSLATYWLIPRLGNLQQQHPELNLQIVTSNRLCDFDRENIDLGIRYGDGRWSGYQSTKLLSEVSFPVASKSLLGKRRGASIVKILGDMRVIVNALHPDEWSEWCAAHGVAESPRHTMLTLTSGELVFQAAIEGVGIAMGRRPIVDPLIKTGQLVAVFPGVSSGSAAYYLVSLKGKKLSSWAAKAAAWLKEQASDTEAGL